MSPFDLYGPQFLLFYLVLGGAVLGVLALLRHAGESAEPPAANLSDPYLIAYLRGGKNETLRIASLSLIDRGFLTVRDARLVAALDRPGTSLRFPIERHLFDYFAVEAEAASVFKSRRFDSELEAYENELVRLDLIPDSAAKSSQIMRAVLAITILWGVAVIKIGVALAHGRSNIQYLVVLAILFAITAFAVSRTRQTRRGVAMVGSLRTLFSSLNQRSRMFSPGANPDELLFTAAVFGMASLPASAFPYATKLYPKSSSSGGCGSSCSSWCGGGGCGGGCGGCGS